MEKYLSIIENIVSKEEFRAIFLKRRIQFDRQSIKKGTESPYYEEGWELYKEFKTKTQIQKKTTSRVTETYISCNHNKELPPTDICATSRPSACSRFVISFFVSCIGANKTRPTIAKCTPTWLVPRISDAFRLMRTLR